MAAEGRSAPTQLERCSLTSSEFQALTERSRGLARKMHRLGRISPKVLIFRAIKIAIQINTVFAEPHRPWLVTCFSWVPITCPRHGRFNCERSSRKSNC